MVSKTQLRKIYKNKRKEIKNKELKEKIITKKIINHEKIINSKNILIYVSKDFEVSTIEIIKELLNLNKNVYVPKVIGNIIKFYKIESLDELELSSLKILEPTSDKEFDNNQTSICIVPGLLFDKNNNRLGYGGGYYDRFLKSSNTYKIGICFKEFIVDRIETEEHDIKMNLVITN